MENWKQRAKKWSSILAKTTQTEKKTRKMAFSITDNWHLLQKWKKIMRKARMYVMLQLLVFMLDGAIL